MIPIPWLTERHRSLLCWLAIHVLVEQTVQLPEPSTPLRKDATRRSGRSRRFLTERFATDLRRLRDTDQVRCALHRMHRHRRRPRPSRTRGAVITMV
jgi:hypothetical protein